MSPKKIKKNKGKTTEARVKTEANRLTKTNPGTRKTHDDKKKKKKKKKKTRHTTQKTKNKLETRTLKKLWRLQVLLKCMQALLLVLESCSRQSKI